MGSPGTGDKEGERGSWIWPLMHNMGQATVPRNPESARLGRGRTSTSGGLRSLRQWGLRILV